MATYTSTYLPVDQVKVGDILPGDAPTLEDRLVSLMVARLTRPLMEGWHVAFPFGVSSQACDTCGAPVKFIRVQADDCDVWGLRGIDGAHSDAYGVYCRVHSGLA